MTDYRLTRLAEADVLDIWSYIAQDNCEAADRMVDRFTEAYEFLARNPTAGERMDQYRPGLRAWTVGRYVVYFCDTGAGIEVDRILHSARRHEDLF